MSDAAVDCAAHWRIVEVASAAPVAWRNGGGVTRELLRLPAAATSTGPGTGDDWMLRISVADIAADGPFSSFAGIDRTFAVVAGAGVLLDWGGSPVRSTLAGEPVRFDGASPPGCCLIDGPTRDLNVMVRRDLATVRVERAQWGAPWHPGASRAALLARVPLRLSTRPGHALSLNAQTLAWCDHVDSAAWTIAPAPSSPALSDRPALPDAAPPGWWIALSPIARAR